MKEIPLTRGLVALVDDEDYEKVAGIRWYAHAGGNTYYAVHKYPGVQRDGKRTKSRNVFMHHLIADTPPSVRVDHIDRNGLNNQRSNLRPATHQQNMVNRQCRRGPSGFVGVKITKEGRFQARLTVNYQEICIGTFVSADEAARARDTAAKQFHGNFAVLNFPPEGDT